MHLHFKESGKGRAVILLHGLLGASDNWHPIAQTLAERFHVIAVDHRNHGHSPHHPEMDYPLMAADVERLMARRGVESAVVIGHSMGGKTAMQLALQFPKRVEKLVVEDIAPSVYAPMHEKIFTALLALELKSFSIRQEMEEALAPQIPNLVLRRFLLKNMGRAADGAFAWKINLSGIAENYLELCAPVSAPGPFAKPALFICGGKSDYVRPEDSALIHKLFPQSQIQTIPQAGHWVHADAPEEFLRLVLDFI